MVPSSRVWIAFLVFVVVVTIIGRVDEVEAKANRHYGSRGSALLHPNENYSAASKESLTMMSRNAPKAAAAAPAKGVKPVTTAHGKVTKITANAPVAAVAVGVVPTEAQYKAQFTAWKAKFKRRYVSAATEARAYAAFKKRSEKSRTLNAKVAPTKSVSKGKTQAASSKKVFDNTGSPIGDVEDVDFKKKFLGGKPKLNKIHQKIKIGSSRQVPPAGAKKSPAAAKKTNAVRFRQRMAQAPIPSTDSVPTPHGGDNLTKKRTGGDNLGTAVGGGDNLTKKRTGGDNLGTAVSSGDNLTKKRTGGGNAASGGSTTPVDQDTTDQGWQESNAGFNGAQNVNMQYDFSTSSFPKTVRNQGECQSCWAVVAAEHFQAVLSSTAMLPTWSPPSNGIQGSQGAGVDQLYYYQGKHVRISAQQLIDCARQTTDDQGCNGGTIVGAFDFIQLKGVVAANTYPYGLDGTQHTCATLGANVQKFTAQASKFLVAPCVSGGCPASTATENALLNFWQNPPFLKVGTGDKAAIPVVAYVDASNWGDYTGGIYPASTCSSAAADLAHIVQIVGYGTDENNQAFWLVRNSWGSDWGENGHIRLPFGVNACGLFNYVIYLEANPKQQLLVNGGAAPGPSSSVSGSDIGNLYSSLGANQQQNTNDAASTEGAASGEYSKLGAFTNTAVGNVHAQKPVPIPQQPQQPATYGVYQ